MRVKSLSSLPILWQKQSQKIQNYWSLGHYSVTNQPWDFLQVIPGYLTGSVRVHLPKASFKPNKYCSSSEHAEEEQTTATRQHSGYA